MSLAPILPAMVMQPYYNHDAIWEERARSGSPLWGAYSPVVYKTLLSLLQQYVPAPAKVIDVGCGAGAFGTVLSPAGYQYVGVDESPVAIALGRRSFPQLDLRVQDFAKAALEAPERFDVITAVNVLHCLVGADERQFFLSHLHKMAQAKGRLLLTTMCAPVLPHYRASKRPRCYVEVAELKQSLEAAGWRDVVYELYEPATETAPISNWTVIAKA